MPRADSPTTLNCPSEMLLLFSPRNAFISQGQSNLEPRFVGCCQQTREPNVPRLIATAQRNSHHHRFAGEASIMHARPGMLWATKLYRLTPPVLM
jgi:hypothetical protein